MEQGASNLTTELPELTQDWGNRLLESTKKKNLVCTRIQEKGILTPKEADPDLLVGVQESPVEAWVSGGLLHG